MASFFLSGPSAARASLEALVHRRVATAYTDWLIAANGIASDLATSRSGILLLLLLLLLILQGSRADVTPALGLLILITALPALGAEGMADARPSTSEMTSGEHVPRMIFITRCQKRRGQAYENRRLPRGI